MMPVFTAALENWSSIPVKKETENETKNSQKNTKTRKSTILTLFDVKTEEISDRFLISILRAIMPVFTGALENWISIPVKKETENETKNSQKTRKNTKKDDFCDFLWKNVIFGSKRSQNLSKRSFGRESKLRLSSQKETTCTFCVASDLKKPKKHEKHEKTRKTRFFVDFRDFWSQKVIVNGYVHKKRVFWRFCVFLWKTVIFVSKLVRNGANRRGVFLGRTINTVSRDFRGSMSNLHFLCRHGHEKTCFCTFFF